MRCFLTIFAAFEPFVTIRDESDQLYAYIRMYVNGRDTLYLKQGTAMQINFHDKVDILSHGYFSMPRGAHAG